MKVYHCKGCGKIITDEDIGFRDQEGNVFCKSCAVKLTVQEREEKEEHLPEVKRQRKLKGIHLFMIVSFILIIGEVVFYVINRPVLSEEIPIEKIVQKMPDIPGRIILIDTGMQKYLSEHNSPPENLSGLFPDYIKNPELLLYNGSMPVYSLSKKWGFIVYYTDENGEILEPVLTKEGFMPADILQEGK